MHVLLSMWNDQVSRLLLILVITGIFSLVRFIPYVNVYIPLSIVFAVEWVLLMYAGVISESLRVYILPVMIIILPGVSLIRYDAAAVLFETVYYILVYTMIRRLWDYKKFSHRS